MFSYPNRYEFLQAIKTQLEPNIFKHSLAVEACMGGIYDYLFWVNEFGAEKRGMDVGGTYS